MRAPVEPPKQTVTLQKRESDSARTAQTRAEEELGRLEKKLTQEQKTFSALEAEIVAYSRRGQTPPTQLVSRARIAKTNIDTTQLVCDNLRAQCNQVDKAQTVGRVARLQEDLAQEKQQALAGVTESAVARTGAKSRATDTRIDRVFDRLTGTQHLDPDEVETTNDAFLADLMQRSALTEQPSPQPLQQQPVRRNNTNNRDIEDILRL